MWNELKMQSNSFQYQDTVINRYEMIIKHFAADMAYLLYATWKFVRKYIRVRRKNSENFCFCFSELHYKRGVVGVGAHCR